MILKVISTYSYYYAIKAPEYKRLVVYYHSGIKYTSIIKWKSSNLKLKHFIIVSSALKYSLFNKYLYCCYRVNFFTKSGVEYSFCCMWYSLTISVVHCRIISFEIFFVVFSKNSSFIMSPWPWTSWRIQAFSSPMLTHKVRQIHFVHT